MVLIECTICLDPDLRAGFHTLLLRHFVEGKMANCLRLWHDVKGENVVGSLWQCGLISPHTSIEFQWTQLSAFVLGYDMVVSIALCSITIAQYGEDYPDIELFL